MSYEGYTEYLCAKGHYWVNDQWTYSKECGRCGAPVAHVHGVDETNGYDESRPSTCDARKVEIGFEDEWHADHYGNRYALKVSLYQAGEHWSRIIPVTA